MLKPEDTLAFILHCGLMTEYSNIHNQASSIFIILFSIHSWIFRYRIKATILKAIIKDQTKASFVKIVLFSALAFHRHRNHNIKQAAATQNANQEQC